MTPTAATHGELDHELRQAWAEYYDRLQPLSGSEYEDAEQDAWTALQAELRRLERCRGLPDSARGYRAPRVQRDG